MAQLSEKDKHLNGPLKKSWIISNIPIQDNDFNYRIINPDFSVYAEELYSITLDGNKEIKIIIDGIILPRDNIADEVKLLSAGDLMADLFAKYKTDIGRYIKGIYSLIIIEDDKFYLFADHFGIQKFFYYVKGHNFLFSNNLKLVSNELKFEFDYEMLAVYALAFHYIGGKTAFKDINYNEPAAKIEFIKKLKFGHYWKAEKLLELRKNSLPYNEIARYFTKILYSNLDYLKADKISLSITGGNDTRNLLAALMKLNLSPHLYTYGDIRSYDAVIALNIAKKTGLNHSIYNSVPTTDKFTSEAEEIIIKGNSLASIHRAHRLKAVKNESVDNEIMLLGTMGGEFIRGVHYDDYIIASLFKKLWKNRHDQKRIIREALNAKFFRCRNLNLDKIVSILHSEPYFSDDIPENEFFLLSHITARLHDAQDINLYNHYIPQLVLFLDIDYLELIFSSDNTFLDKKKIKNKWIRRAQNPLFASNLLKNLFPDMLDIEYTGHYKPKDVLFNKYYAAIKKAVSERLSEPYAQNFPLTDWMREYCINIYKQYQMDPFLNDIFDNERYSVNLNGEINISEEKQWLKYTNLANYNLLRCNYCQ